jgi:hypothetical protein
MCFVRTCRLTDRFLLESVLFEYRVNTLYSIEGIFAKF